MHYLPWPASGYPAILINNSTNQENVGVEDTVVYWLGDAFRHLSHMCSPSASPMVATWTSKQQHIHTEIFGNVLTHNKLNVASKANREEIALNQL